MKNKLLFTFLIVLAASMLVQSQVQQETNIYKRGGLTIVLDGNSDDWQGVPTMAITNSFQNEMPTLDTAYWAMLWDVDGLYVLVEAVDDVWHPNWATGSGWPGDKVELYIDASDPQLDGLGAKDMLGNYQFAPNFSETDMGVAKEFVSSQFPEGNGVLSADTHNENGVYTVEYFIPYTVMTSNNDEIIDPNVITVIGFDVTIVDVDDSEEINRAVWSNVGDLDESWNNCDQVGLITFSDNDAVGISPKGFDSKILTSNRIMNTMNTQSQVKQVVVYSCNGSKVYVGSNSSSFNISFLNKGLYIAKIADYNGNVFIEKIVKD